MPSVDTFIFTLKRQHYSITKPRLAVFNAMQNSEPLTIQQLVDALSKDIDRASIYRTVELLVKLDIVRKIQIGWKYRLELSDKFSHHHHHASCKRCHAVISLKENVLIEQLIHEMAKAHHFHISDHQLEVTGICNSCQRLQPA